MLQVTQNMVHLPVIHLLKLMDYLSVQADKPCFITCILIVLTLFQIFEWDNRNVILTGGSDGVVRVSIKKDFCKL